MSTTQPATPSAAPPVTSPLAPIIGQQGVVKIEGQEIKLKEEIIADDAALKKVLRPYYSAIANASITRKREDGVLIAIVVKRADYKGARRGPRPAARQAAPADDQERIINALRETPPYTNPALALARRLQFMVARKGVSFDAIERMGAEIDQALAEGEDEARATSNAVGRLKQCRPIPTSTTPAGF